MSMHRIVDETKVRLFVGYDTLELVELHNSFVQWCNKWTLYYTGSYILLRLITFRGQAREEQVSKTNQFK